MSYKFDTFPAKVINSILFSQIRCMSPVAVPVCPGLSAHPAGVRVGEADLGGDQLP